MDFNVKILLLDTNKRLYDKIKEAFELESIQLVHVTTVDTAISTLAEKTIFLLLINCDNINTGINKVVYACKSKDLFIPIIILTNDDVYKEDLLYMGINIFYKLFVDITELTSQSFNLITLYQAKKNSKSQSDVFKTLSTVLSIRDPYTSGHGERVAMYATTLYDHLGFRDYDEREVLRLGCIIHDVGKIGTPDSILRSGAKLSPAEFETIKNHPGDGVRICLKIITDSKIIDIIEHHHEKIDGTGYPHGLQKNEIEDIVQITTICDIYDALTSERAYSSCKTQEDALNVMDEHFYNINKINKEYYTKFKELLLNDEFINIKYI